MMPAYTQKLSILITGASGVLGQALVKQFSMLGYTVYALDIAPLPKELQACKGVHFISRDITDKPSLFLYFSEKPIKIDFVIHLAAFWSFKPGFDEFYERINIEGTKNILQLSDQLAPKRFIFSSSVAAVTLPEKMIMTEDNPPDPNSSHPYGWSKARSELDIQRHYDLSKDQRTAASIVRISGVFDDWCRLPPLAAVMRRWSVPGPIGSIIPGAGKTGLGYLHIDDFAQLILQIVARHAYLDRLETLLACPAGVTTHQELYPFIREGFKRGGKPIFLPLSLVRFGFQLEKWGRQKCGFKDCIEEAWMFDKVDNPEVVDPTKTFLKTKWQPLPERHVIKKIPALVNTARKHWTVWNALQDQRMHSNYFAFSHHTNAKRRQQKRTSHHTVFKRPYSCSNSAVFFKCKPPKNLVRASLFRKALSLCRQFR